MPLELFHFTVRLTSRRLGAETGFLVCDMFVRDQGEDAELSCTCTEMKARQGPFALVAPSRPKDSGACAADQSAAHMRRHVKHSRVLLDASLLPAGGADRGSQWRRVDRDACANMGETYRGI